MKKIIDAKLGYDFEYRVLNELPVTKLKIYYFPKDKKQVGQDGVIIRFSPNQGASWIGIFAFGDIHKSGECEVYPGPGDEKLTVVARGEAYIVSANDPDSCIQVKSYPVIRAIPVPSLNLILFHDYTEIVAYNKDGFAWETNRISWDGIKIEDVSDNEIIGKSWDSPNEKFVDFRIDISNGNFQGGSYPPTPTPKKTRDTD